MSRDMIVNAPTVTRPEFTNDVLGPDRLVVGGIQLDATAFNAVDAAVVTLTANAAASATSLTVAALANAIPSGTALDFGGLKFARTTAAAAKGATTVAVAATPTAMVTGDKATYAGAGILPRIVPAGTIVGRTIAEETAGTAFGPAADADDIVLVTATQSNDLTRNAWTSAMRPGMATSLKIDFLPLGWANVSATIQGKLRAAYLCQRSDLTS